MRDIGRFGAGDRSRQHRQHGVPHHVADRQRLIEVGDEEVAAAGGEQRCRHRRRVCHHSGGPRTIFDGYNSERFSPRFRIGRPPNF